MKIIICIWFLAGFRKLILFDYEVFWALIERSGTGPLKGTCDRYGFLGDLAWAPGLRRPPEGPPRPSVGLPGASRGLRDLTQTKKSLETSMY